MCIILKKYLLVSIISLFITLPVYAQTNPSLLIEQYEPQWYDFNIVGRDAPRVSVDNVHGTSWQVTLVNNLLYTDPQGSAVLKLYDENNPSKFIEIGMGSSPTEKFWVAVWLEETGYVVVHNNLERGWIPGAKIIASYSEIAGLTVNNGERIVVTNLDIDSFAISQYSVHGLESTNDPPIVNSGSILFEIISGDPTANPLQLYPYYLAIAIGIIIAILLITKKR